MKIMTILGTRPEIIRLSRAIPILDNLCEHIVVHTGQNYNKLLNGTFFDELGIRLPNYLLECKSDNVMGQICKILIECEKVIIKERPDRILILGDTNSALSSIVAKRYGIPVFHMEAGNRCYDDRVPEEVNRRIVDHCSDVLMPYTERSRANLLREGIEGQRIYVTGNPIHEVLEYYADKISSSNILGKLNLVSKKYFLVTLHRSENVDIPDRLNEFIKSLSALYAEYRIPVICNVHPRTSSQMKKHGMTLKGEGLVTIEPLGLFDFVYLEKNAYCVLSDSGTVQEECCIFKIPGVTLRDVTERPETVESGSNIISGCHLDSVLCAVEMAVSQPTDWKIPEEYLVRNVSCTISNILLGYLNTGQR